MSLVDRKSRVRERRFLDSTKAVASTWRSVVCVSLLGVTILGLTVRAARHMNVPGEVDVSQWVLQDFRDAVYYPVVAFVSGENPYDSRAHMDRYPVLNPFSPYSPLTLAVHLPFGLLPHSASQILFYGSSIAMTIALASLTLWLCGQRVTVAAVSLLSSAILVSRPGHWNLLLGQTTQEIAPAAYVAAFFASSNVLLSGIGLAMASLKPSFGVPLALILLTQRLTRPVAIGFAIAAAATVIPLAIIVRSAGGLPEFVQSYWEAYTLMSDNLSSSPVKSPVRIDAVALVGRLIDRPPSVSTELLVLGLGVSIAGAASSRIRRLGSGREVALYRTGIASTAILVSTYHLTYGAILLTLPISAILFDKWIPPEIRVPAPVRWVLLGLLLLPVVNYGASFSFLSHFRERSLIWLIVSSANGLALLAAFTVYAGVAFLPAKRPASGSLGKSAR